MRSRSLPTLLAVILLVAGCGSDDDAGGGTKPAQTPAEEAAFPAKVEHQFGTTTVPAKPRRIVVVGVTEQDTVLALGYKPIATTEWYGGQPYAVWPWARDELGAAKPTVLDVSDGFQFEKIAGLRPDLIIGVNAGMDRTDYKKLSRLAPTIAAAKGSTASFSPWDEQVGLIAASLGKREEGRALVERIKSDYAKAAEQHPEFAGKTVTFSQNAFYNGLLYVYPAGLNTEFLTLLGFEINPKLTRLVKKRGEQVTLSGEQLPVIDADVILFATEKPADIPALKRVPTFNRLPAVAEHRAVYTDGILTGAIYFISPLSLPYVLERLTPQLKDAVEGKAPQKIIDPS